MVAKVGANDVADFILHFCHEHGDCITNLKLQKLAYYAQAWYLALNNDQPLFDEPIEAWVHGPVVPSLYQRFRTYRWEPIPLNPAPPVSLPANVQTHLKEIMDVFGGFSAYELERMTHEESPWLNARGDLPMDESSNAVISHKDMSSYYKKLIPES